MRLDLIFTMKDIYINSKLNLLSKFINGSRIIEFKRSRFKGLNNLFL